MSMFPQASHVYACASHHHRPPSTVSDTERMVGLYLRRSLYLTHRPSNCFTSMK